jgi:signal transduction histidine kinase
LLIVFPAIANMYLTDIGSYRTYTLAILAFLLVARIRDLRLIRRYTWTVVGEAAFAAFLFSSYGGDLYFLLCSTLLSLSGIFRRPARLWLAAITMLAVLNAVVPGGMTEVIFVADITFAAVFCLLLYAESLRNRQTEADELLHTLSDKNYELHEMRNQLLEYARKVENAAQVEERNRISRELHDDLGHKLIRLKMMMDAAVQLLPAQESKGPELVRQVRDQLADTMETMRTTVRKLKPDASAVRQYSLDKLIGEFGSACGVRVNYEVTGIPYELYPSEEVLLYRNAQEAMTNAVRHGKADEVWIRLSLEPKRVVFIVSNNGIRPEGDGVGRKGLGLSGMEERAELLGGTVSVDWSDRFTVTTVLPHRNGDSSAV